MTGHRVYAIPFASVYPLYVQKAEKKGRTKAEVNEIIQWLTGYTTDGLTSVLASQVTLEDFYQQAPALHPRRKLIHGVVCDVRVEEIKDPVMQEIRYMDKLIDELARGKTMEQILR